MKALFSPVSGSRSINFDLSLHLHPYFDYASNSGPGESVHTYPDSSEPSLLDNAISACSNSFGHRLLQVYCTNHILMQHLTYIKGLWF